jgi:hypothetical protein
MSKVSLRVSLMAVAMSLGLAACLETINFRDATLSPAASGASKANAPGQVRAQLRTECLRDEDTSIFGIADEKISKQCDCYADGLIKSMRKEDITFFQTYGVVPTLTAARPEDVRKRCGLQVRLSGPKRILERPEHY